ncbi:hypothetical protein QT971_22375 [Microcoleus sp. herbarium19]|uniref:hypothetical protein n=1 Tax=unclassified Microcoleus TaxID=2642155 RepID=UPI002FD12855
MFRRDRDRETLGRYTIDLAKIGLFEWAIGILVDGGPSRKSIFKFANVLICDRDFGQLRPPVGEALLSYRLQGLVSQISHKSTIWAFDLPTANF